MLIYQWDLLMKIKRTHVVISDQLLREIDSVVGSRQRSRFLSQAAERELMRLRQLKAIDSAAGSWKDADHPELKQGSVKWVKILRQERERHFEKASAK
jgi:metal-responsive CopG/Arc/MetJ family transcriptional regulator